jgi:hypothetical protein
MAWERFIAAFDSHGSEQDDASVEKFFKFSEQWKPKHRIMGGDLWNFPSLRKGASDDEKRLSLRDDLVAGKKFFNRFKPHVFLLGNHDSRLWNLALHGQGVMQDYAIEGVSEIEAMVKSHKCKQFPYHKRLGVYELGSLKVLHGYFAGLTAARRHAQVYGSCLFGHTHSDDQASVESIEHKVGYATGCLCKLDQEYNSTHVGTLRQSHGFAYGVVNLSTGNFHLWKAKEIEGKWMVPSDIVEL